MQKPVKVDVAAAEKFRLLLLFIHLAIRPSLLYCLFPITQWQKLMRVGGDGLTLVIPDNSILKAARTARAHLLNKTRGISTLLLSLHAQPMHSSYNLVTLCLLLS